MYPIFLIFVALISSADHGEDPEKLANNFFVLQVNEAE
jgi:hypothetical protein